MRMRHLGPPAFLRVTLGPDLVAKRIRRVEVFERLLQKKLSTDRPAMLRGDFIPQRLTPKRKASGRRDF
jgi:hypothetical protein